MCAIQRNFHRVKLQTCNLCSNLLHFGYSLVGLRNHTEVVVFRVCICQISGNNLYRQHLRSLNTQLYTLRCINYQSSPPEVNLKADSLYTVYSNSDMKSKTVFDRKLPLTMTVHTGIES